MARHNLSHYFISWCNVNGALNLGRKAGLNPDLCILGFSSVCLDGATQKGTNTVWLIYSAKFGKIYFCCLVGWKLGLIPPNLRCHPPFHPNCLTQPQIIPKLNLLNQLNWIMIAMWILSNFPTFIQKPKRQYEMHNNPRPGKTKKSKRYQLTCWNSSLIYD